MFLRRFASTAAPRCSLPPTIRQLLSSGTNHALGSVTVTGFVKSVRRQKRVAFAAVNDGSSPDGVQAVFDPELAKGCAFIRPLFALC
jgi:asparaginyl-tRNA synthetase